MSSTAKIALAIIVVILIIAAYFFWPASSASTTTGTNQAATTQTTTSTANSGNTDSNLNQDTASIDAQMNALNSDNANLNSSFSDTPVQQSY